MNEVILSVCRETRNYHEISPPTRGEYIIADGEITLNSDFEPGDWIAITGSRRSDGVYLLQGGTTATFKLSNGTDTEIAADDGHFTGAIYRLNLTRDRLNFSRELMAWMNDPENAPSAIDHENVIGVYSWSRRRREEGRPLTWVDLFAERLQAWGYKMWETLSL